MLERERRVAIASTPASDRTTARDSGLVMSSHIGGSGGADNWTLVQGAPGVVAQTAGPAPRVRETPAADSRASEARRGKQSLDSRTEGPAKSIDATTRREWSKSGAAIHLSPSANSSPSSTQRVVRIFRSSCRKSPASVRGDGVQGRRRRRRKRVSQSSGSQAT